MSDRDLLAYRDPDALRKLKQDVATVRADPEVAAAFHAHDYGVPGLTVEALRSGVMVDGLACRLTAGTFALLRSAGARVIGQGDDESPLSAYDIALGVFLVCDECRNEAISVVDDEDLLRSSVSKFGRGLKIKKASEDLLGLLSRVSDAISGDGAGGIQTGADPEPYHPPEDSWADDVDLVCHEYGWSDDYALWELPLARLAVLRDAIGARRSGKQRTARRSKSTIALLELVERKRKELCVA